MRKYWWLVRQQVRLFLRKLVLSIRGVFFVPTSAALKSIRYRQLPSPVHWEKVAGDREVQVEIGSGHGEVLLANDAARSIRIGYEIKSRFFALTFRKIRRRDDVFVYQGSGYESLKLHYTKESVDIVYILFPDPWHKKRHSKRRPITSTFFQDVAQKLKKNGKILVVTDWVEYADFIANEAKNVTSIYEVTVKPYSAPEFGLPITHYHQKWVRHGRTFTAILLQKKR